MFLTRSGKDLLRSKYILGMIGALFFASISSAAENRYKMSDFDQVSPELFSFTDDKGSVLKSNSAYYDDNKGKYLGVRYKVVPDGWAGLGIGLNGHNADVYRYLALDVRGKKGGEIFSIGLRDEDGKEKKFPINRFSETSKKWKEVLIPLKVFSGVNLKKLNNVHFSFENKFGEGQVYIDNIRFEGSSKVSSKNLKKSATLVNKALVDGFERTNPFNVYQVFQDDESILKLTSSRVVFEGDYAMEMEYEFATSRPWGAWVTAVRYFREMLDWRGADTLKMWVKGDGSENLLRFRITEPDGEKWEFINRRVLGLTKYTLVRMPFNKFTLVAPSKTNGKLNLKEIRSFQIDIMSSSSKQTAGAKAARGRVYLDQLYISGQRIRMTQAMPPDTVPDLRKAVTAIGNVDLSVFALTEYFFSPEEKSLSRHFGKLITNAKLSNYSARLEIESLMQEFGDSAAFIGSTATVSEPQFARLQVPNFQVMANNVSPYLTNLTFGNVYVDYSPYTFSPVFGFKGVSAEGDYDRANYHFFAVKHALNSFTVGNRTRILWPKLKLTGYTVYWEQNARVDNPSQATNNTLQSAGGKIFQLERIAQDLVYNLEAETALLKGRINLKGVYGYNRYRRVAEIDTSNLYNPKFKFFLDHPITPIGEMWRGKILWDDFLLRGLRATYEYRDVGTAYKPRYRQNPEFFDDAESDQWGHNVRFVQNHRGWVLFNEFDSLRRHSSPHSFRRRNTWGVGHYGYKGIDVAFFQEYRRAKYTFTSDRSGFSTITNEKVIMSELYVRTQLSPRIGFWIKPKQERIWHPMTNNTFRSDILHMKLEYYIGTNARFFAEHKTSRFSTPDAQPVGSPYDDNFTKVTFEVTF